MRPIPWSLLALLLAAWVHAAPADGLASPRWREDRLLLQPRAHVPQAVWTGELARLGLKIHRHFPDFNHLMVLELPAGERLADLLPRLQATGWFEFVEPDYRVRPALTLPNDPRVLDGSQWALHNPLGSAGLAASEAWDIQNTASNIIVAVVDSGVRLSHEDLADNLWVNPREIPGNGRDDDGNGLVDDIRGINAIGSPNSTNLWDDHGHGTHVTGIIGAVANNGRGGAGVAWRVPLMICKFMDANGNGYISDAVECFDYARQNGAKIINASFGTSDYSSALDSAVSACRNAGIIVVAAAGNDGVNLDTTPFYPASLATTRNRDNVVAVAASDRLDNLASFSNFGSNSVHLCAPGQGIYSTYYYADNSYVYLSGTSMAAPYVAGALALMRARFPVEHHTQIIRRMLDAVDVIPALEGKCRTSGRLNLHRALANYQILTTNYAWISLTNALTLSLSNDGVSPALPLPFVFNLYGRNFTEMYVGANGLVGFTSSGLSQATNTDLSGATGPINVLCPYWDDLNPASNGTVTWGVRGEAPRRLVVVSWNGVPRASSSSTRLTFQTVLNESDQTVVFQYQEVQPNRVLTGGGGRSATVGIRGQGTPEEAVRYTVNGSPFVLANQTAFVFVPLAAPAAELSPATNLVATGPAGGPFSPPIAHYELANLGNIPLAWWTETSAPWLETAPTGGVLQVGQRLEVALTLSPSASALPAGHHTALAQFFVAGQDAPLAARSASLSILGTNAALEVSPASSVSSSGFEGGPFTPATFLYTLMNTGDTETAWLAWSDAPWLELSATNGLLEPGGSHVLTALIAPPAASLAAGSYTGHVHVANLSSGAEPLPRPIVLEVTARPGLLVVTPENGFQAEGTLGGAIIPAQTMYLLSNTGPHSLAWQAATTVAWAEATPSSGVLLPNETIALTVAWTETALPTEAGDYQGLLLIENLSSGAGNTTRPLGLRLNPEPGRLMFLAPESNVVHLAWTRGETNHLATATLVLTNTGGTEVIWSVEAAEPWLEVAPADGRLEPGQSAQAEIWLTLAAAELAAGLHTNQVRLLSLNGTAETNRLEVVLEVQPMPGRLGLLPYATPLQFHRFDTGPPWPESLTLTVTNHGELPAAWAAAAAWEWLQLQPAHGTLDAQASATIQLTLNSQALPSGPAIATNFIQVLQGTNLLTQAPVLLQWWPWPQLEIVPQGEGWELRVPPVPEREVWLETSTNLGEWHAVLTNAPTIPPTWRWQVIPAEPRQFFRLRLPANPVPAQP